MFLKIFFSILFICAVAILFWNSTVQDSAKLNHEIRDNRVSSVYPRIKGISLVAPPKPFKENPAHSIRSVNAEWIAVIPYAYTPLNKPEVKYGDNSWQWWGETEQGARKTIVIAKENKLKVMLKPQVYIHKGWTGSLDFANPLDWEQWESQYSGYLLRMASLAEELKVELFCIGTEFNLSAQKRPAFWFDLIAQVKKIYKGKICYSANWDDYALVPFWDELDYIGISAYFPLSNESEPDTATLKSAWTPYLESLAQFADKHHKQILFTEYGYLTVSGCAGKTWELEKNIRTLSLNEEAQAVAYHALFSSWWDKDFWAGGFVWKWFPDGEGHEGYPEKDYTPQGKKAEEVLRTWYAR